MIVKLISLEYKKFKNNAVIQLLSVMFILILPTAALFGDILKKNPNPVVSAEAFYNFPTVWEWMGYSGNWLAFMCLGFIAIFLITSEVSNKTMRQSIIIGMTRKEFFIGKLTTIILLSLIATLYYILITVIIGSVSAENLDVSKIFDNNWAGSRFFLMCMGYTTFGLFLGFLFRHSGFATFFYMAYVMFLEPLLKWVVHSKISMNKFMNYYPLNTIEDLHPFPIWKFAENIPTEFKGSDIPFLLPTSHAVVGSAIYVALFIGLSYLLLIKRDV